MSRNPKKIFLSYIRDNSIEIEKLVNDLAESGVHIWIDRNDIAPGQRWKAAIRNAIRSGDYFLACFSREYASRKRTYMNEELMVAIEELRLRPHNRIWFLPVRLSTCDIPEIDIGGGHTLRDLQWVDLFEEWDIGIKKLLNVIKPISPEVQLHIKALESSDSSVQIAAINALIKLGDTAAIPALTSHIRDYDPGGAWRDYWVGLNSSLALAHLGSMNGVRLLMNNLHSSYYMSKVREGFIALSKKALPTILRIFSTAKAKTHWEAIDNCALILTEIGDETIIPELLNIALNESENLHRRSGAIYVLGKIRSKQPLVDLCHLLQHKDKIIRIAAARAIMDIEGTEETSLLSKFSMIEEAKKFRITPPMDEDWD